MTTTPAVRRSVRLKEFGPLVDRELAPQEAYRALTNGTLGAGPFRLRTDADGFIARPGYPPDAPKVFVLGDSFVESSFIPEGLRFCDQLTQRDAAGQGRVFLSGGYSGATSLNLLDVLVNKVARHGAVTLVFVLPSNDVLALANADGYWNAADKRYSPLIPVSPDVPACSPPNDGFHQLAQVLQAMAALADAFRMRLHLATCPFVQARYQGLAWFRVRHGTAAVYEDLLDRRRHANRILREVAAARHVPLIDLEQLLADPDMFYDDVHLNEAGSAHVAQVLHERV